MPAPESKSPAFEKFSSPMPKWQDEMGPRFIPFWQTAIAALAAVGSVAFALLLYSKL
jgi:hypothetical protein